MTGAEDNDENNKPSSRNTQDTQCPVCRKKFDSVAEVQKHLTVEHMQKGEIPEQKSGVQH